MADRLRRILKRVSPYTLEERFGLEAKTGYRYRRDGYYPTRKITDDLRAKFQEVIEAMEPELGLSHDVSRETSQEREERPTYPANGRPALERQIDEINALDIDEVQKTLRIEALAALYRASAIDKHTRS